MRIALLASRRLRHGPMSPLLRFARDFMPFLEKQEIVTTEGCYRAFLRAGLFWDHPEFNCVGSGYRGALVRIASGVVPGMKNALDAVIYLIDPRDPSSNYPETNALKRECVVHQKPFLATSRSARLWSALAWSEEDGYALDRHSVDPTCLPESQLLCNPLSRQTIALIAHDNKKKEILEFVREHFAFLSAFQNRVGTGTTGTLLNGLKPRRIAGEAWKKIKPLCTSLKSEIDQAKRSGKLAQDLFVAPLRSGPEGGDVQIARMVLDGECQTIVFFEDPSIARQHEQDIQLLERTGRTRGKEVICIHDPATASYLANRWGSRAQLPNSEPLLVATALERRFKVKAIVVEAKQDPWERIIEAASWYLMAEIAALAADRRKQGDSVRVTISWGVGLSELAQKLRELPEKLRSRETLETELRKRRGEFPQALGLADDRYFRPGNVKVGPMQGIMAAADDAVEANTIAQQLADFFDGQSIELALAALMADRPMSGSGDRREIPSRILEHWDRTDLLVTTCAPVKKEYSGHVPAPDFGEHYKQVERKTCGDFGGIYLTREGVVFKSDGFKRIGMDKQQISSIRARGGQTVLIAGSQSQREEIAFTVLNTGLMSVVVTDLEFAKQLLARPQPSKTYFSLETVQQSPKKMLTTAAPSRSRPPRRAAPRPPRSVR